VDERDSLRAHDVDGPGKRRQYVRGAVPPSVPLLDRAYTRKSPSTVSDTCCTEIVVRRRLLAARW
jgi:hypothetical protein